MLKKIQRRFILAAMAAFGTVMLLIIVGINAANYYRTTSMQDHLTAALLSNEQTDLGKPQVPSPPVGDMRGRNPEAAFMTRFFTVHCDADGRVREVLRDYISSVDEETAKTYAQAVLSKGREKGYYKDYRYLVSRSERGISILFLNSAIQLQSMRSLLLVSLTIGLFSLLMVFFLILLFSRRAIQPYRKNLERQKQFITDAGHESVWKCPIHATWRTFRIWTDCLTDFTAWMNPAPPRRAARELDCPWCGQSRKRTEGGQRCRVTVGRGYALR